MTAGLFFGFSFAAGAWVFCMIMHHGRGRTIGGLCEAAFWTVTAIAILLMPFMPMAAGMWLVFAFLVWAFFLNRRKRGSGPRWASMLGFTLCAGLLLLGVVSHLTGLDRPAPHASAGARQTIVQAPAASWLDDDPAPREAAPRPSISLKTSSNRPLFRPRIDRVVERADSAVSAAGAARRKNKQSKPTDAQNYHRAGGRTRENDGVNTMKLPNLPTLPWNHECITIDEFRAWVESRPAAAEKIDIETCEINRWAAYDADPYGLLWRLASCRRRCSRSARASLCARRIATAGYAKMISHWPSSRRCETALNVRITKRSSSWRPSRSNLPCQATPLASAGQPHGVSWLGRDQVGRRQDRRRARGAATLVGMTEGTRAQFKITQSDIKVLGDRLRKPQPA
jgi:hypothetical protein